MLDPKATPVPASRGVAQAWGEGLGHIYWNENS